tara:strand:- start:64 stop:957 length:894 start_codon:yes stop_codon:yes gene_type:complete
MKLSKKSLSFNIIFLLFLFNFLMGCSETTFLVNSAKRIGSWGDDPVYKVGNPYKINGKWYYPAIDYNYEEIGIASWYGPGFHGKKTANGEIFNQNKISAAHRTLPMPSIVKVTNLDNGLILERVRINDRGPFAGNRIIDLSKKAAEELGFVNAGTARVKVQILEDESRKYSVKQSYSKTMKAQSAKVKKIEKQNIKELSGNIDTNAIKIESNEDIYENSILKNKPLAIQVGAFTDHRNAKSLTAKLSEFKAYIERIFVDNRYLYRVRIGPIENIKSAESIKDRLFKLGHTASHLIVN